MGALTPDQVAIIKATVPVLAEHGNTITTKFYSDMINANPELKNVFNTTHQETGHQPRALAGSLYAYAANIDNLGALSPALELICHKHTSLFIRPEQYAIVGEHLIKTMKAVLGDAASPAILDAWGAAYWQLANIMIAKEDAMYKETAEWADWKDFTIVKKEKESEEITSFYLEPVDATLKLPKFKPGQYISVNVFVDGLGVWQARQYSLSDAPGKNHLRISVKREPGVRLGEPGHFTNPGYISNILHDAKEQNDLVKVSHPFGDFFFDEQDGELDPVVLVSAGVGLTALTSIFNALTEKKSSRPISWIQGARNSDTRAFKKHFDQIAAANENVHTVYFSSSPMDVETEGEHYDIKGRVDLDKVDQNLLYIGNDKARYFICGPTQFMLDVEAKLKSYGVPSDKVKMELFGTGGVPRI